MSIRYSKRARPLWGRRSRRAHVPFFRPLVASDRCPDDIFRGGYAIATLDACRHLAEMFSQTVARKSGQRVDWHYSGGRASVLYLGDHARVDRAAHRVAALLGGPSSKPIVRKPGECGSCHGSVHRVPHVLEWHGHGAHGLYRAGDPLPVGVIGLV